ncbi:hypothetical protein SAMN06295885_0155 [Rathayibacter oskolensis]|uniref:Uncharacterized protein n=1 Tax=Rathayibacter oskolensis TaxID=1891671 RepID=A0A1X7MVF7_9MICO|nr:hypothetical protein [Rathayibacter oskolensis]SMH28370.1 hypothetical protein SAMN06295885_0155 [Rathayibacter oskolensis]
MQQDSARPLQVDDAVALVAILAALEALVAAGRLADSEVDVLRHGLELGGTVLLGSDADEIAAAIGALNGRLRDSIG